MSHLQSGIDTTLATVEAATKALFVKLVPSSIVRMLSENDAGLATGSPYLLSPEFDDEYRLRVSDDIIFDYETDSYTAQNTTKHVSN